MPHSTDRAWAAPLPGLCLQIGGRAEAEGGAGPAVGGGPGQAPEQRGGPGRVRGEPGEAARAQLDEGQGAHGPEEADGGRAQHLPAQPQVRYCVCVHTRSSVCPRSFSFALRTRSSTHSRAFPCTYTCVLVRIRSSTRSRAFKFACAYIMRLSVCPFACASVRMFVPNAIVSFLCCGSVAGRRSTRS